MVRKARIHYFHNDELQNANCLEHLALSRFHTHNLTSIKTAH